MIRRECRHLAIVYAAAILLRVILYDKVAIWGDMGFYQYDARLILQEGTPFIDFLGRSPVFNYLYAAAAAIFGRSTPLIRGFMHFWWLLTSIFVYLIARRVRGHRTGLGGLGAFLFAPFALAYGSWANTQSVAAFFGIVGVYLIVRSRSVQSYALAGAMLGIAYLSRRSIIVILFAVWLYTAYYYMWYGSESFLQAARRFVVRNVAVFGGFLVAVFAIYGAMAGFDPTTTWALFEVHTVNLFISYGRGGYPLIGVDAPIVTNELGSGYIPIFNDLCQMCGAWTARTFAKTIIVTIPVVALLWFYMRDLTDYYFQTREKQYMFGVLGILGVYGMVTAWFAGYYIRTFVAVSAVLFAVVAYRTDSIEREILYDRDVQLVLVVLLGLAAGYLYRRRVLHTYYFMDFWPYLSVLAGVVAVRGWEMASRHSRKIFVVALVLATIASTVGAHPMMVIVMEDNEPGWFTPGNVPEYTDDINGRTDAGDVVLTTNPSYVALSHAKMPMDRPRLHMVAVRYKSTGPGLREYRILNDGIESGSYQYAIVSRTLVQMFRWNATFREGFTDHYCRVESADELYQHTNSYLFEWKPEGECPPELQPSIPYLENATSRSSGVRHDGSGG